MLVTEGVVMRALATVGLVAALLIGLVVGLRQMDNVADRQGAVVLANDVESYGG